MVLDSRCEDILMRISLLDYVTVEQISRMFDLKGKSNKYRVIRQLKPYLNTFKDGNVNVYALNREGRTWVNTEKKRGHIDNFDHHLMRNDLYIYLGCPATWRNEIIVKYTSQYEFGERTTSVRTDAHYVTDRHHVIEIDNQQKMKDNVKKIDKYRTLIGKGTFSGWGGMPELIWVTRSSHRKKALLDLCDGLDVTVYLWSEIENANQ